jgi:hypothetical protein
MAHASGKLRYRKKGGLAWRELTPGAMPDHGELWEVQSPDGSIALLSRSDAPAKPAPAAEETDSFHLDFAQTGTPIKPAPPGSCDFPVYPLSAMGSKGPEGSPASTAPRGLEIADPKAFGILVDGNGLEPRFSKGQVILVDTTKGPGDGDWAFAVLAKGETRIARWASRKGGKVALELTEPTAKPIELPLNQVRFAYKIVSVRFP